jgi:hypothetical protein
MDTSSIDLAGSELLVEALARNAHEVWAELRMNDGWTYGPSRDDVRKQHPCLVRFDDLSESDRASDRAMMAEILKAVVFTGFRS